PPQAGYGYAGGPTMQPSQTGDFLRNAASTAAGVAGGALLFQGIRSLFSRHQGGLGDFNPFCGGHRERLSEATLSKNEGAVDPGAGGERDYAGSDQVDPGAGGDRDYAGTDPMHGNDRDGLMNADYEDDGDMDFGDDGGGDYA